MWSVIKTAIRELWPLLPPITAALRFATALIGFAVALIMSTRRIRRWVRRQRGTAVRRRR
jgi:hypothetical protein